MWLNQSKDCLVTLSPVEPKAFTVKDKRIMRGIGSRNMVTARHRKCMLKTWYSWYQNWAKRSMEMCNLTVLYG